MNLRFILIRWWLSNIGIQSDEIDQWQGVLLSVVCILVWGYRYCYTILTHYVIYWSILGRSTIRFVSFSSWSFFFGVSYWILFRLAYRYSLLCRVNHVPYKLVQLIIIVVIIIVIVWLETMIKTCSINNYFHLIFQLSSIRQFLLMRTRVIKWLNILLR